MQTRSKQARRTVRKPSLLELPDALVELIAEYLPPQSMAQLQSVCKHLRQLIGADRLWEAQLQQNNKEWAAAGIVPVPGREQGQTWKDLVKTAYKLQGWKPDTPPANAHMVEVHVSNYSKLHKLDCIRELWNSASDWLVGTLPMTFKLAYLRTLLDNVYFFWYDERQLARGAKFLLKALQALDAIMSLPHGDDSDSSPHDLLQLGMLVPSAGAFLVDLLQMRSLPSSPVSFANPTDFMDACQGNTDFSEQAQSHTSDTFDWCGADYSCDDLKKAAELLIRTDALQDQALAEQSRSPWDTAGWKIFNGDAQHLLNALADRRALPDEDWQMPGTILLHQAAQNAENPERLKSVGRCRAHQLFAGATLCFRLHDRLDRCMTAYAEHGLMYEDARQHHRAAYYYKQAIMTGTQNPGAAVNESMDSVFIGIAEAYDGAWQDTGTTESYRQAFAWRKFGVQHMLSKPDKTQYERERVCETLHSMGLLLEDHSCRGGGIAELDNFDVHLLAVGAYMTGLRQVDANATVIAWICSHAEMADAAEEAFIAFLHDRPLQPTATPTPSNAAAAVASAAPSSSTQSSVPNSETAAGQATGMQDHTAPAQSTCAQGNASHSKAMASAQGSAKQHQVGAAAQAIKPLPAELTVKHVGFLGSLAHALVHMQKSAEGLALLRAAAYVMRHSPPHYMHHHTHSSVNGAPDSKVLHAHVLMDLGISLLGERLYEEALAVFTEGLDIAQRAVLGDRVLSTFHDHVAHTILQLRQQRACHQFLLPDGKRVNISWQKAQQHAEDAVAAGQRCKPYEAALEASPLTTLGDIASAMCMFPTAKTRYMAAFNKLFSDDEQHVALTPSNAAEAATTLAAVADMQLKMGEVDEAESSLGASLRLLEQYPCQLPALQIKRTELYLTTLQMQIHIFRNDLPAVQQKLQLCIALTQQGAEYRPGFVRYDEALTRAAEGDMQAAREHFEAAEAVAEEQQDRQLATMACTALGLLLTSTHFPDVDSQQTGWEYLQRGLELAGQVGDMLCEVHAAEGILKVLAAGSLGRTLKNRRELKRSLQDKVQTVQKALGDSVIESSCRMLSFAGL